MANAKAAVKPAAIAKAAPTVPPIQPSRVEDAGVAPLIVASNFEPKTPRQMPSQIDDVVIASGVMAGGSLKPLVVAPIATTYTVVYRYAEKGSAEKFMDYLRAYGVNDFTYRYSDKLHQHLLVMGKYTSKDQAAGRIAFLNRTTFTTTAQLVETDL
ncbi:SPOR domain-containing protein [Pseudomonas syringae pv. actinidiae]|nr:SPOR domain-containing protein [Pseudomonas syringae pv. actinidiae]